MEKVIQTKDLPSRGLLYEVDQITISTIKGKDEKILAEINEETFNSGLNKLLSIKVTGIDITKLTVGDRQYLLLWLAVNSYPHMIKVEEDCILCGNKLKEEVDLTKLEVIQLDESILTNQGIQLTDGTMLSLRLLLVEDELMIDRYTGSDAWAYRYALSINQENSILDRIQLFENMDACDTAKIRAFQEKYTHGINMEVTTDCTKCEEVQAMPIPFRLSLLLPYGEVLRDYIG